MASLTLGPSNRNPDYGRGEHNYAHAIGAQTAVLARGGGHLHSVVVGVVGTLAKFYDVVPGGSVSAANQIATVSLAALTTGPLIFDAAFQAGLTCVITGDASTEVSISYQGGTGPKRILL